MNPQVTGTATSTGFSSSTESSYTFPHTVPADANCLVIFQNNRLFDGGFKTIASITFDGVAMTQQYNASDSYTFSASTLMNPHPGTHNVVITWVGPPNSAAISVINVKNTSGFNVKNKDVYVATSTADVDIVTTKVNELVLCSTYGVNEGATSYGTGQTQITNFAQGAFHQSTSWKDADSPGSTTMTVNFGGTTDGDILALSFMEDSFVPQTIGII